RSARPRSSRTLGGTTAIAWHEAVTRWAVRPAVARRGDLRYGAAHAPPPSREARACPGPFHARTPAAAGPRPAHEAAAESAWRAPLRLAPRPEPRRPRHDAPHRLRRGALARRRQRPSPADAARRRLAAAAPDRRHHRAASA